MAAWQRPSQAANPDNAWKWHKWAFNEYCKVSYTNFHSQAPARKSLASDPDYLASFASFESVDEWNYALETTVSLPVPNNGSEAINIMMAEWERVMLGEITVEEMVATVTPQMNDLIKDTPQPKANRPDGILQAQIECSYFHLGLMACFCLLMWRFSQMATDYHFRTPHDANLRAALWKKSGLSRQEMIEGWLFAAPFILGFLICGQPIP